MRKGLSVTFIVSALILGFVVISLLFELTPSITALDVPENTTPIIETTLGIAKWLIPTAAGVGVIMAAIAWFAGRRK